MAHGVKKDIKSSDKDTNPAIPAPIPECSPLSGLLIGLLGVFVDVALLVAVSSVLEDVTHPADRSIFRTPEATREVNFCIGIALIAYLVLIFALRFKDSGAHALLEMTWGCNVSMLLAACGAITGRSLLIGVGVIHVAIDQIMWYVDVTSKALAGRYLVGAAAYMSWKISWIKKVTSLHHLWFMPVCLYLLRQSGLPPYSWHLTVVSTTTLAFYARYMTPYECILTNPPTKKHKIEYLNINLSYAFWKDVKFPLVHLFDFRSPFLYIPYLIFLSNVFLNGIPYLLIAWFSDNYLLPN